MPSTLHTTVPPLPPVKPNCWLRVGVSTDTSGVIAYAERGTASTGGGWREDRRNGARRARHERGAACVPLSEITGIRAGDGHAADGQGGGSAVGDRDALGATGGSRGYGAEIDARSTE